MKNIFLDYTDFINNDTRIRRPVNANGGGAYKVTANVQYLRHSTCLPADALAGKTVLDLGCAVAATGAWVLHNQATKYVGVELQEQHATVAKENLSKYFPNSNWEIKSQSLEDFFNENNETFDIVVLFGVIYTSIHFEELIKQATAITNEMIVVDSIKTKDPNTVEVRPFGVSCYPAISALPGTTALDYYFNSYGFWPKDDFTQDLTDALGNEYLDRYCVSFVKGQVRDSSVEQAYYQNPTAGAITTYNSVSRQDSVTGTSERWEFNNAVASAFVDHARHHIPGYDKIIEKSVEVVQQLFDRTVYRSKIIDVGCATGQTLIKFQEAGFRNLYGVDSSSSMLEKARELGVDLFAVLYENDTFPGNDELYTAIICNWTLHFIQEKYSYIKTMYDNLEPGGALIITDKTYNDTIDLKLYRYFKKTTGLTAKEIQAKEDSVRDIMFINPPEWYLATLQDIGFSHRSIINAEYCFTTFLAIK